MDVHDLPPIKSGRCIMSGDKIVAVIGYDISQCRGIRTDYSRFLDHSTAWANASRIEAAPDLLAALRDIVEDSGYISDVDSCECGPEGTGFEDGRPCVHIKARRAIAKATG